MGSHSLWTPRYVFLLCYSICISTLFYAVIPLLTEYTTQGLNLSLAMAGLLSGLFSVASVAARPLSGYLSDYRNPLTIFLLSLAGLGLCVMAVMFVHSVPGLILLRAVHGILYAFSSTSCFVLLNRRIPLSRLNEGIGYYGVGQILSSSLGMSLGIFLMDYLETGRCFLVLGLGLILVPAVHLLFFPMKEAGESSPPDYPEESAHKKNGLDPAALFSLLPFGLLGMLFSVSNGVETTFLALLGNQRSIGHVSLFFTCYVTALLISRPFTARFCDTHGLKAVLYPALLLMAAESVLIGNAFSLLPLLAASLFKALGQGTAHPALQAECIRRLGYRHSGTASAVFLLFTDLGQGLGPMAVGYAAGFVPFRFIFYGICVLYLGAVSACSLLPPLSLPPQPAVHRRQNPG